MTRRLFSNPVLPGFYPDPSICRCNEDYFLVTSSFVYFPGIPIFHSRDIVRWEQTGYALDRPEQLALDGIHCSGGIYAPTIRYNDGMFYITSTLVGRGGSFVVMTADPYGEWSDPVFFEDGAYLAQPPNAAVPWVDAYFPAGAEAKLFKRAPGIDPSLFFDDDGSAYYTGNRALQNAAPGAFKREIWLSRFNTEKLRLEGEQKVIWTGSGDFSEGPHIYKKDGYYYLLFAEGGTFERHAVMAARSESVDGPYEACPDNPIITHRELAKDNPIMCVGHGDIVRTQNGEWYIVLLATRPENGCTLRGRETFLAPVAWENGWPVISPGSGRIKECYPVPDLPEFSCREEPQADCFDGQKLDLCWNFLRTPGSRWWSLGAGKGGLTLLLRPERLSEYANPSFIGRRISYSQFTATARACFDPENACEEAGLALLQNADYHYRLVVTLSRGVRAVRLIKRFGGRETLLDESAISGGVFSLRAVFKKEGIAFLFAAGDEPFCELYTEPDKKTLSTEYAGGFTGAYMGMYASSNGKSSKNSVLFNSFVVTTAKKRAKEC